MHAYVHNNFEIYINDSSQLQLALKLAKQNC